MSVGWLALGTLALAVERAMHEHWRCDRCKLAFPYCHPDAEGTWCAPPWRGQGSLLERTA